MSNSDLLRQMNLKGTVNQNKIIRPNGTRDVMASSINAIVDSTPQLLRPIRPFLDAITPAPLSLPENARLVLDSLLSCFRKEGYVREGKIKDVLFGFQVTYPNELDKVAYGIVDLRREGYVKFIAPDGIDVDENCDKLSECWLGYTQKLLDHVYGG